MRAASFPAHHSRHVRVHNIDLDSSPGRSQVTAAAPTGARSNICRRHTATHDHDLSQTVDAHRLPQEQPQDHGNNHGSRCGSCSGCVSTPPCGRRHSHQGHGVGPAADVQLRRQRRVGVARVVGRPHLRTVSRVKGFQGLLPGDAVTAVTREGGPSLKTRKRSTQSKRPGLQLSTVTCKMHMPLLSEEAAPAPKYDCDGT